MSTKNLARTVIEGGRYHGNTFDRRRSHRAAQAEARALLESVALNRELADDMVLPERRPVRRCFRDKLGPADRWMRSQVGRPWHKVQSEMLLRFDTRTLAGRHIVFDHMSPWRCLDDDGSWQINRTRFRIDAHGVLRIAAARRWGLGFRRIEPSQHDIDAAMRWSHGRRIRERGKHLYWLEPTDPSAKPAERRYRQGKALTLEERAQVRALPELWREILVEVE